MKSDVFSGRTARLFVAIGLFSGYLSALLLSLRLPGLSAAGSAALAGALTAAGALSLYPLRRLAPRRLAAAAVCTALLLLARLACFPIETSDFTDFLQPWTEWFRHNGGLGGLGHMPGNYNVPYMVFLALISRLPVPELYLIKLLSVYCDLLLAVVLGQLVKRLNGCGTAAQLLTLALPTVFLNGAVWGQCDSVYAAFALLALWLCLSDRPLWAMASLAVSFSFKLQAVFLIPVFLPCIFAGKLRWRHLPVFPAVYTLMVLPAVLAGRGLWETLLFYVRSAGTVGGGLNYNSPSMYSLLYFYRHEEPAAATAGIAAAFVLCLVVFAVCFLRRSRLTGRALVYVALLLCCALPLLLPHMHERYFFLCDLLCLAAACIQPRCCLSVPLSQFASLLGYHAYFFMKYLLPMRYGFFALLLVSLTAAYLAAAELFPVRRSQRGQ